MLLESRIDDRLTLAIDCEAAGGIDKGGVTRSHPDLVLKQTVTVIRAVAEQLASAANLAGAEPPSEMEIRFGVRVDSNAVVAIARETETAQFQITLRWKAS